MVSKKIAFVGGGQLARMIALAGVPLGMSFRSAGAEGSCAFDSCEAFTDDLNDEANLDRFLDEVDVFTFESEHEGLEYAERVAQRGIPIYPPASFVEIAGDRFLEKSYLLDLDIPVAPFLVLDPAMSAYELDHHLANVVSTQLLSPHGIVIKTRHGGYDGKGQWVIQVGDNTDFARIATEIIPALKTPGCIVEGLIDFSMECSIIAARSISGEMATWPLTHNIHRNSILRRSSSPITGVNNLDQLEKQAKEMVTAVCNQSEYVGTIAIECFVTAEGLVVNEIAPRVHNSGHWTIEGSATSQFEQHVRAITGMPLGDTSSRGFAIMINLIGRSIDERALAGIDDVHLHWYNKEVRHGRKVGHITILGATQEECDAREQKVLAILEETRGHK